MTIGDILLIAFVAFVFYWVVKIIYILVDRTIQFINDISENIVKKNKIKKNKDVLDKLLRNKIGKDCVSVVREYLHANDYEFVKVAFYAEYEPNIEFSILRTYETAFHQRESVVDASEYEILENLGWYRAKYSRSKGIDYESIELIIDVLVNKNYQKCIMFILQHFPIDSKKIIDVVIMQDKLNLLKSIIKEFPHSAVWIKFGEALGASSNSIIDYLHFELKIPLPKDIYEKAIYENVYNQKNTIKKFNWIYSVGVKPTYNVFHYVHKRNTNYSEKIVVWLIDHNCPIRK